MVYKNRVNVKSLAAAGTQDIIVERCGLVVEPRTLEREVRGSRPTSACCVLEQRHIYSQKSTGNTQEAVAPSRHD